MTKQQVKEYLREYRTLVYNHEFLENRMAGVKAISYSQEARGTAPYNPLTDLMAKLDECEEQMEAIRNTIEYNLVGLERLAIWDKYINFKTIEQIADEQYVSFKTCQRAIDRGCEVLSMIIE